ncbi:MAG TPA: hypothetical protein VFC64_01285 [Atopostipes sp.]|nr:hypothetical protein [Atopostipes sp.]
MSDTFIGLLLLALLSLMIFSFSAIVKLVKREPSKDEWKKVLFFIILSVVFFILFSMTM